MSNINVRINSPDENSAEERKQCIYSKLNAIEEQLFDMSIAHCKLEQLTIELSQIQKSEEHSSNRCLGKELNRLTTIGQQFDDLNRKTRRNVKFVRELVSLRCNDESVTCVKFDKFLPKDDYEIIIGDCLTRNSHVTNLVVTLPDFIYETNTAVYETMFHYIHNSAALRRICVGGCLRGDNTIDKHVTMLLNAIESNTNVEQINWYAYVPPTALHRVLNMSSWSKTKCLSLRCGANEWEESITQQRRQHLMKSIADCTTLVKLVLTSYGGWRIVESILNHLADVSTPLQELALHASGNVNQIPSLTRFLQGTTTLRHLEFQGFKFRADSMESILAGLNHHYALPTACISKVSMKTCEIDDQAIYKFSAFMQETRYYESNPSVLHELELHLNSRFLESNHGHAIATSLVYHPQIHSGQHKLQHISMEKWHHTIGSRLETLKLEGFSCVKEFCDALQTNAKYISLRCLHLKYLELKDCTQLAPYIPKLLSLQELCLDQVCSHIPSHVSLLYMIQQCGNLQKLSIQDRYGSALFTDSQSRLANAFCDRNQALILLFSKTINWDWRYDSASSSHDSRLQTKRLKGSSATQTMCDYDTAVLFPMLLHVAKQAQTTRVSTIMKGLLHLVVEGVDSV